MRGADRFIWSPGEADVDRANVTRLMRTHGIETLRELSDRSVADVEWFWDAVVRDLDIEFSTPYERVVDRSRGPEWATWFVGARTNVARQCVDRWAERTPDAVAVVWEGEDGDVREASYATLGAMTDAVAATLLELGVRRGDTVALLMPMAIETVVALMACSKIGATWVPIFSGFGPDAVAARIADARCEVVITANATLRKGTVVPMKPVADRAAEIAGGVRHVVVWDRLPGEATAMSEGRDVAWPEPDPAAAAIDAEPLDSEHPLFIGYTSGTTGRPKGAVHVHGGFLVKIAEEVAYQVDLHAGERLHWATDLGWIMGPWEIVGSLALGATVVLTEGSPLHPRSDRLMQQVARHRVNVLGVSPTLVRAMRATARQHLGEHDRSSLRVLASTGEPWDPDSYRWLHEEVGEGRRPIVNLSGGTEVGACFLSPHPVVPTKVASLGGPALGMDLDIVDDDGVSVPPGAVGELICRQPWPSMTRGIWGDPERYLDTYWRRFEGVWTHGDWASRDDDGYWFLHGRSDDTLNVAGKRIGPAEIESAVATHASVAESAAVGLPDPLKGESIACVVVLRAGEWPEHATLSQELRAAVREHLGSAFTPRRVVFVDALPKTRSAKIVRRAVRAALTGGDPGDLSSLEDAGVVDAIRRRASQV
ncbi:MAG TPA: AMP-binding protein [Actinomycetota bacterium]|nr:AMP-binding protein [Actinomycetota bacterium]